MERVRPFPHQDCSASIPIDLRSEPDCQNTAENLVTRETILAKIRDRYDNQERQLTRLRKRLRHHAVSEADSLDDPILASTPYPTCTYPTTFGTLSFEALHQRTRKYAASALRHTYQVNETDIDDGLQAGYLRLWQRLQKEPELLEDKAMAWIGKGIIFTALHTTRGDWQFRRHTASSTEQQLETVAHSSEASFRAHSRETRRADTRTDLHRAIGEVADHILAEEKGKREQYDLWALYGLTMLQVSASEMGRLFGAPKHSMQMAYNRVRKRLQESLPNYVPVGEAKRSRQHGREALPMQDMKTIRKRNGQIPHEEYEAVKRLIEETNADTRWQDELALAGIWGAIPAQTQARAHGLPTWRMQRAYDRVHLMIGSQHDPTVRVRRPERRVKFVFTLTEETTIAVEQLALDLLNQAKSYEKMVALHAHISNLPISTTAKHFNIPTSTLRYYTQQIGAQLGTPTRPAREE